MPLFSILIPVYNVENYLTECLESVVHQTFHDYEVIVIDDGSTDNSGKICDKYASEYKRIKVYHQRNRGLMMTRKEGIQKAQGTYCLFLDSDDYYELNLLELIYKYIEKFDLSLLIFDLSLLYRNNKKRIKLEKDKFTLLSQQEAIKNFLEIRGYNSVVTKVIKRELILPHLDRIYVPINYAEDALQTAYFLSLTDSVGILNSKLYHYRMRAGSLVHKKNGAGILESLTVRKNILEIVTKTVRVQDSTKERYMVIALVNFMEDIFGMKKMKMSMNEYILTLEYLMQDRIVSELLVSSCVQKVAVYHKIRILLLKSHRYVILFALDSFLLKVQQFVNLLMNKKYFD